MNQNAPVLILQASKQPYLSIGVRYGGIKAFGYEYLYIPTHDAFLRKDYQKKYKLHLKSRKNWEDFVDLVKKIK
jgi:hypothetical protein